MKRYWEQVTLEVFGEITQETLEKARPIAQARIQGNNCVDDDNCPFSKVRLLVRNGKDEESQPFCKLIDHWCDQEGPKNCPHLKAEFETGGGS
jgi:hypothetical protein